MADTPAESRAPKGRTALITIALAMIPVAFLAGLFSPNLLTPILGSLGHSDGWRAISFKDCFGYDIIEFRMPPAVSLPTATRCTGRFRVLEHGSKEGVGFEIEMDISHADLADIPESWRQKRLLNNRYSIDGATEVDFDGVFELDFLDRHGFKVTSRVSRLVSVRSGQTNRFKGTLISFSDEESLAITSAEAILSLTRCGMCTPPPPSY